MLILELSHPHPVHTLAFSPDGKLLALANGRSWEVALWDLETRCEVARFDHGHRIVCVLFAPGGEQLLSASSNGAWKLWDLATPRTPVRATTWHPYSVQSPVRFAFSPDGTMLVSTTLATISETRRATWAGKLQGLRLKTGKEVRLPSTHRDTVSCLAYSPDGAWLATGSFDREVHLNGKDSDARVVLNHGMKVHHVAFSPDGRTIASASPAGLVKVWDAETGKKRNTLRGQANPLHALCYSPDGQTLATAGGEGVVTFWDVSTTSSRTAFDWGVGEVHAIAFAPDGMRAAAGGTGQVVLWDIDDWGL